ncbi:alpha/beta hydrolase [Actinomadura flavalba]|uniref:alpha/beta hydrolase n=1 Tax=Actinomadura flavalba TaxID=1120938 RepID=UPI0004756B6C|nr:alpha/beta fold hydrolase [Actinomadura flavalba]
MATFVLVPGFWLGAWAWDGVAARLRASGHTVRAVTLRGLAERADEADGAGVDDHVADIVAVVEDGDLRDVVLVGHSGAAVPVTGAAERLADRLARVVYVDTAPLPSGLGVLDFWEPEQRAEGEKAIAATGGRFLPPPPFTANPDAPDLAGLSEADLALLRERATPEPAGAVTGALHRAPEPPAVPATMVATSIPLPAVRQMIEGGAPMFAELGGERWSFAELPTGHWPMLSEPERLADLLAGLA